MEILFQAESSLKTSNLRMTFRQYGLQSWTGMPSNVSRILHQFRLLFLGEGEEKYRENRPLKVIGISCAGEPTRNRVESGTCARISTGKLSCF